MLYDPGTPTLSLSTGEKLTTGPQSATRDAGRCAAAGLACAPLPGGDQLSSLTPLDLLGVLETSFQLTQQLLELETLF